MVCDGAELAKQEAVQLSASLPRRESLIVQYDVDTSALVQSSKAITKVSLSHPPSRNFPRRADAPKSLPDFIIDMG